MKPPVKGWIRVQNKDEVIVPSMDGKGIAARIPVTVPAWKDPASGDIFYDGETSRLMEDVKARHMGILLPGQLRELRTRLGHTQKEMSRLLQLGERTWTRWETGRERPSRSMNVLLMALWDGRVDVEYLTSLYERQTVCAPDEGVKEGRRKKTREPL